MARDLRIIQALFDLCHKENDVCPSFCVESVTVDTETRLHARWCLSAGLDESVDVEQSIKVSLEKGVVEFEDKTIEKEKNGKEEEDKKRIRYLIFRWDVCRPSCKERIRLQHEERNDSLNNMLYANREELEKVKRSECRVVEALVKQIVKNNVFGVLITQKCECLNYIVAYFADSLVSKNIPVSFCSKRYKMEDFYKLCVRDFLSRTEKENK